MRSGASRGPGGWTSPCIKMDMTALVLGITALSVLLVLGISLLRRGLRGRRVGDHPVCGTCGFDLFGLPDDQAKCPECGNDLGARGAVQTGHRVRRVPLAVTGAAMLLLFTLILGTEGVKVVRQIKWQQVKPAAWLAREARNGSPVAWMELGRRARVGELSDEHARPLVADALAWQKDLARVWLPAVGDFIEDARAGSRVTDADWATYCRQAPQFLLRWRAKVRRGDPLPGSVSTVAARVGSSGRLSVRINGFIDSDDPLVVQPRRSPGAAGGHSQSTLNFAGGGGSSGVFLQLDPKAVTAAPLGKRATAVHFSTEVRETWDKPGTVAWTHTLSSDWELVSPDAQTVERVPDDNPKVRQQIEAGLKVIRLDVQGAPSATGKRHMTLAVQVATPPVPLAFDAFLRSGGREWKLTTISFSSATQYHTGGYLRDEAGDFDARRVDVILRPAPQAAYSTVDITRVWMGEIVIPDVEAKWPATRPTTAATTR